MINISEQFSVNEPRFVSLSDPYSRMRILIRNKLIENLPTIVFMGDDYMKDCNFSFSYGEALSSFKNKLNKADSGEIFVSQFSSNRDHVLNGLKTTYEFLKQHPEKRVSFIVSHSGQFSALAYLFYEFYENLLIEQFGSEFQSRSLKEYHKWVLFYYNFCNNFPEMKQDIGIEIYEYKIHENIERVSGAAHVLANGLIVLPITFDNFEDKSFSIESKFHLPSDFGGPATMSIMSLKTPVIEKVRYLISDYFKKTPGLRLPKMKCHSKEKLNKIRALPQSL